MPSGNAGVSPPELPPELIADRRTFEEALARATLGARPMRDALPPGALERLFEYGRILHEKAAGMALIAKGDRPHLFTRHILDSLNPLSLFEEPPESALDVGSGGGLPGIPLAIAWPRTRVVLLESRERKAGFLELAVRSLKLENARVVSGRLEDFGTSWREEPAASVFVRALGDLSSVLAHASRVARPDGRWVYFLGSRSAAEALGGAGDETAAEVVAGAFGGRLLTGRFDARHR